MFNFLKNNKISLPDSLIDIKKDLKKKKKNPIEPSHLREEKKLIQEINDKTKILNINNVTRTKAYLDFYNRNPEIHWSFLGHMVSRNGGWNMTDLKGGQLSTILTRKEVEDFFLFLERGNWLIFQDIYPQFLLYETSKLFNRSFFYLLPRFNVSSFMETIWNDFWKKKDIYILTVSLIINEQNYLEERIIKNPIYQKKVIDTLEFKIQDILSLNHILFPYKYNNNLKLVGQSLHHFQSLHERILLGKRLYKVLFTDKKRLKLLEEWANKTPHTGSRKDYWPHLFNDINEGIPGKPIQPRIVSCKLTPGSVRIYSPKLLDAWKNRRHEPAENKDWYKDWQVIRYLVDSKIHVDEEIENEYCKTLERIELAATAKKAISTFI